MTMQEKIEAATQKFVAEVLFAFCNHAMLHFKEEYLASALKGAVIKTSKGKKRGWPKGKPRGPRKAKRGRPAGSKNKVKRIQRGL